MGCSYCEDSSTDANFSLDTGFLREKTRKPKLLLHSCCGPCSTAVIERLADRYDITIFFYNPNITDEDEYRLRKATQIEFLKRFNSRQLAEKTIEFIEGDYNPDLFYKVAKGLECEREGGARCEECFILRLKETARLAAEKSYDVFGTTLTVSPYKNYEIITMIGSSLAVEYQVLYLDEDFKKKAGYQRSIELSKEYGLYRQHYCGCEFSKPNK